MYSKILKFLASSAIVFTPVNVLISFIKWSPGHRDQHTITLYRARTSVTFTMTQTQVSLKNKFKFSVVTGAAAVNIEMVLLTYRLAFIAAGNIIGRFA